MKFKILIFHENFKSYPRDIGRYPWLLYPGHMPRICPGYSSHGYLPISSGPCHRCKQMVVENEWVLLKSPYHVWRKEGVMKSTKCASRRRGCTRTHITMNLRAHRAPHVGTRKLLTDALGLRTIGWECVMYYTCTRLLSSSRLHPLSMGPRPTFRFLSRMASTLRTIINHSICTYTNMLTCRHPSVRTPRDPKRVCSLTTPLNEHAQGRGEGEGEAQDGSGFPYHVWRNEGVVDTNAFPCETESAH